MMAKGNLFDSDSAKRISDTVVRVEAMPRNGTEPERGNRGPLPQPVTLTYSNDTGETVPKHGVFALTDATMDTDTKVPKASIAKPSATIQKSYAVNDYLDVVEGDSGQCYTHGHCKALYDTGTPAVGETWIPKSGQWTLTKGEDGAAWCVVVVGIVDSTNKILLGKITTGETAPWFNFAASTCPAFGVACAAGVNGTDPNKILKGDQPSATVYRQYFVNSAAAVLTDTQGAYQKHEWVLVKYDTGTPAFEETWIPKDGQWTLTKGDAGAPWGIVVAGIVDSTAKILLGKIVENESKTYQFHNKAGSAAPAYATMQVTGAEGEVPKIGKPTLGHYDVARDFIVNDDAEVADDTLGDYQNRPRVKALYYTSGTPAVGELWGPTDGQWYLSKGAVGEWCILVSGIVDATGKVLEGSVIRSPMAWGKIQSTVTNQSGATQLTVSVKSCTVTGATETGDAFNVKTPIKSNSFTDLVSGDVVGYVTDSYGEKTIVTDCWMTVNDGKCWVGLDTTRTLIHLTPISDTVEADPTVFHSGGVCNNPYYDDGGHYIGSFTVNAVYTTGTVTTSGAGNRTVTLTGGIFPVNQPDPAGGGGLSWAINMFGVGYIGIATRGSDTVITLVEDGPALTDVTFVYRYHLWVSPWSLSAPG